VGGEGEEEKEGEGGGEVEVHCWVGGVGDAWMGWELFLWVVCGGWLCWFYADED